MSGASSRVSAYRLLIVLIHINDILHGVPEKVDVVYLSNKEVAEAGMQQGISNLANQRSRHKLTFQNCKCKVTFFISDLREA